MVNALPAMPAMPAARNMESRPPSARWLLWRRARSRTITPLENYTAATSVGTTYHFYVVGNGQDGTAAVSVTAPDTAGNVATTEGASALLRAGADAIKVGIGPGSVCTTRIQTGVGYPQLSAIIECADAAHGLGGHIIADGGCTCPGDIAKAFGGGADFVMLGGMLAGHNEGGGEIIAKSYLSDELDDTQNSHKIITKKYVKFYGMSSDTAMNKHHGGVAEYRSSEGRTVEIPYRGPVKNTVLDMLGGLRSTCTYVGAPTLKQLPKCTTFVRVGRQANTVFFK